MKKSTLSYWGCIFLAIVGIIIGKFDAAYPFLAAALVLAGME